MIGAGVLAGTLGAGLWLIARALWPSPRPLRVLADDLVRPREAVSLRGDHGVRARGPRLAARLATGTSTRLAADLSVLGRSPVRHALDKLGYAAIALVLVALGLAALALAGLPFPTVIGPGSVLAATALGWWWPDAEVRSKARMARRNWSAALTVYVDIVGISLAGGSGVEDALLVAARAGAGPQFRELAAVLRTAQTRRQRLWDAMDDLGARSDIPALRELAASIELAAESGSRIRETLIAKAAAMRIRQLTEIEADAQKASETMGTAPALMAVAAVILIGYPAVARFFE